MTTDPAERRRLLRAGAALAASGALASCSLFPRPAKPVCPDSPDVSSPSGPLTIDAHCHVFNGTDLQIREFFSRVAVRQGGALGVAARALGSVLQEVAWSVAPTGTMELRELGRLAAALQSCTPTEHRQRIASLRQEAYGQGLQELRAAARRSVAARAAGSGAAPQLERSAQDEAVRIIEGLPGSAESYVERRNQRVGVASLVADDRALQGLVDFVVQNLQYRYVSVHDYLRTYNQPGARVVDLMMPSCVDYDFWLAGGRPTLTPLSVQVDVMRQIAILTGGRVHAFVPFDPLRQVAHELRFSGDDSFSLVTDAIESRGCIGVKLYPPMGFAPLGNRDLKAADGGAFWARPWLPEWTARRDLGDRLDAAMARMLGWCERHDVPVMAHTGISNGVCDDFEALAGSSYWALALAAFPKLRVSFGHFGDSSPVSDGLAKARGFTALMSEGAGLPGSNAYADAGYFVEVLAKRPDLLATLRQLYEDPVASGRAQLATRFMYGTDWEMTLTESGIGPYLGEFVQIFEDLEARPVMQARGMRGLSSRFFGLNAAEWAGLRPGEPARRRLDAFYSRHGVRAPDWATKLG